MTLKYYLTLVKMLFMIFVLVLIMQFDISIGNYKYRLAEAQKETLELKKNIVALGGLGLPLTEIEKAEAIEIANEYQDQHGLERYEWKYPEILCPVDIKDSYVTSECGNRIINGNVENAKSIDVKQKNKLDIKASIDGFCRVTKDNIYGYNILIENLVMMEDELGDRKINKVKVRLSHLSKIFVKDGQWIKKGKRVAYMGNTGRCATFDYNRKAWREITEHERRLGYGMHLDIEIEINGYLRNPFANSTFGRQIKL